MEPSRACRPTAYGAFHSICRLQVVDHMARAFSVTPPSNREVLDTQLCSCGNRLTGYLHKLKLHAANGLVFHGSKIRKQAIVAEI
jgi:hypothetical protein